MSENSTSRRDLLRNIALSATLGGVSAEAAQHVHHAAAEEKKAAGVYKPKILTAHEFKTMQRLADLIIPADEVSKGALDSGAVEFIDLLSSQNPEMASIYTGGIAWLDRQMSKRYGSDFVTAKDEQQTAMLDLIAYRKNKSPELDAGIRFFEWARKMVADAFYTSPVGIKDLGFMGNKGMAKFEVPAAAIDYAVKRSGL
ncbi:MAG TPA: gluconate 2-dehydrogenase subunit 3 family protein [Bryobacteraceae bacterium]|nr:gluconate 2-dehydrogenase subunit 3 family protein [Bryobacteraceae bacterium]